MADGFRRGAPPQHYRRSALLPRMPPWYRRPSANEDWFRQPGWKNHDQAFQAGSVSLHVFRCRHRQCRRAEPDDRRATRSIQHEAGRNQRPAGAQRLPADHPSSGRSLDRLYRPSRRHRRHSGSAQPADRQGRAQRHLHRRCHRSRAAEISAAYPGAGRQIRGRRRADGPHLRRQGAAQGRPQCGLHAAQFWRRGA